MAFLNVIDGILDPKSDRKCLLPFQARLDTLPIKEIGNIVPAEGSFQVVEPISYRKREVKG